MDLSNVYSFVIEILELEWTGKNGLSNGILLEVHLVHFRLSLAAYRTSRFSAPLACRSYPKLLETAQARQYQLCICVEHSTSFVKHLFNFQSRDNNSLSIIIKRQRPPKAKSKNAKRHLKTSYQKPFCPRLLSVLVLSLEFVLIMFKLGWLTKQHCELGNCWHASKLHFDLPFIISSSH